MMVKFPVFHFACLRIQHRTVHRQIAGISQHMTLIKASVVGPVYMQRRWSQLAGLT